MVYELQSIRRNHTEILAEFLYPEVSTYESWTFYFHILKWTVLMTTNRYCIPQTVTEMTSATYTYSNQQYLSRLQNLSTTFNQTFNEISSPPHISRYTFFFFSCSVDVFGQGKVRSDLRFRIYTKEMVTKDLQDRRRREVLQRSYLKK